MWYWREGKGNQRLVHRSGAYRGPAKVLMQERKYIQGESKESVWIVDGDTLIRCPPYHLRSTTRTEDALDSIAMSENSDFQSMTARLKKGMFLDLLRQQGPTDSEMCCEETKEPTRDDRPRNLRSYQCQHQHQHRSSTIICLSIQ